MGPHSRPWRSRRSWLLLLVVFWTLLLLATLRYRSKPLRTDTIYVDLPPVRQSSGGKLHTDSSHLLPNNSACATTLPYLGFDYPDLRPLKKLLEAVLCTPAPDGDANRRAYAAALLQGNSEMSGVTADGKLQQFLGQALALIWAHGQLRSCSWDPTLLHAWQEGLQTRKPHLIRHLQGQHQHRNPLDSLSVPPQATPLSSNSSRYLVAANLHNSGHTVPNLILQLLHLTVLLPPGKIAISMYESGSSDQTRYWLNLLHLLLLPLQTPHYFVTAGDLKPQKGVPRIALMAALRNAALQPFLGPSGPSSSSMSSSRRQGGQSSKLLFPNWPGNGPSNSADPTRSSRASTGHRKSRLGPQKLSAHMGGGFQPDFVVFTNDVYMCAGDVVRLAAHQADISCGMDFYSAPWDNSPRSSTNRSSGPSDDPAYSEEMQPIEEGTSSGRHLQHQQRKQVYPRSLHGLPPDSRATFAVAGASQLKGMWDAQQQRQQQERLQAAPWAGPWQHTEGGVTGSSAVNPLLAAASASYRSYPAGSGTKAEGGEAGGAAVLARGNMPPVAAALGCRQQQHCRQLRGLPSQLRFYDKWVARDVAGGLLSNLPPYLHHPVTQQQLLSGYPVPVYCCWNGLAVLRAAPLARGLHFRQHAGGECRASECSLLCDDYHRLGLHHVVMDPGVKLAYDFAQVWLIQRQGAAETPAGAGAGPGVGAGPTSSNNSSVKPAAVGDSTEGSHGADRSGSTHGQGPGSSSSSDSRQDADGPSRGLAGAREAIRGRSRVLSTLQEEPGSAQATTSWIIPVLSWQDVAPVSAALAAATRNSAAGVDQPQPSDLGAEGPGASVECCDLQQGKNYVNFQKDCHRVDVFAVNYTLAALGSAM